MWIAKLFRSSLAYSELESLAAERTAELQKLTQRLLKLQDQERRKLARDLHDTTGQTLAALNISVSVLQEQCKEMPAILAMVAEVPGISQHAFDTSELCFSFSEARYPARFPEAAEHPSGQLLSDRYQNRL